MPAEPSGREATTTPPNIVAVALGVVAGALDKAPLGNTASPAAEFEAPAADDAAAPDHAP